MSLVRDRWNAIAAAGYETDSNYSPATSSGETTGSDLEGALDSEEERDLLRASLDSVARERAARDERSHSDLSAISVIVDMDSEPEEPAGINGRYTTSPGREERTSDI